MLKLVDVSAGYAGVDVLHAVSISIPANSITAVLGPNGSGKSTLLGVAGGTVAARSGRVLLRGQDVTQQPAHQRVAQGMCHIPATQGIFPSLTVAENLAIFGRKRAPRARHDAVDAFPRLGAKLKQVAGTMSGGEQQMLALARAWMQQPTVLLVDEPSLGLAPGALDDYFAMLATVVSAESAVLLVEQHPAHVLGLADHVYVLVRGAIVHEGPAAALEPDEAFRAYMGGGMLHPDRRGAAETDTWQRRG